MTKTIKSVEGEYCDSGMRSFDRRIIYEFFKTGSVIPSEYTYVKTSRQRIAKARKYGVGMADFQMYGQNLNSDVLIWG